MKESRGTFIDELVKFSLIALVIVLPIRLFIAQPFIVEGSSMVPNFHNADYIIVDQLSYHLGDPKRGDVITMKYPEKPSVFFIKRIIGLPGETVSIQGSVVTVIDANGVATVLDETYLPEVTRTKDFGNMTVTLGSDQYFVMGDNRTESSDSRIWGPLPADNVVGRAFIRLFPFDAITFLPG